MEKYRVDPHTHPIIGAKVIRPFSSAGKLRLSTLVRFGLSPEDVHIGQMMPGLNGIAVTSFEADQRFETVAKAPLPEFWEKEEGENGFTVYTIHGEKFDIFRGQEYNARFKINGEEREAHILSFGGRTPARLGLELGDALREREDAGAVRIIDDPTVPRMLGGLVGILGATRETPEVELLREYAEQYDAIGWDAQAGSLFKGAGRLAERLGKPLIAGSNFHMSYSDELRFLSEYFRGSLEDYGKSFTTFDGITGETLDARFAQIRDRIKSGNFDVMKTPAKIWSVVRWHPAVWMSARQDGKAGKQIRAN